jgi:hypothetical protein
MKHQITAEMRQRWKVQSEQELIDGVCLLWLEHPLHLRIWISNRYGLCIQYTFEKNTNIFNKVSRRELHEPN